MDLENMDYLEKIKLARGPDTSEDVLRELAKDENWEVRWYVADNCNSTPAGALLELAQDVNWQVRWCVARNSKSSSNILVMLFEYEKSKKEPSTSIIKALYKHKNLPHIAKVIIETLYGDLV